MTVELNWLSIGLFKPESLDPVIIRPGSTRGNLFLMLCKSFDANTIGGSKGGARDARPPWGSKFFHFHAVSGDKIEK